MLIWAMFDCRHKLNQIGVRYHKLEGAKEKRCKLMFEKKKKNKAHKLTFYFPTASHKIITQKSFNEIHVGALLWL